MQDPGSGSRIRIQDPDPGSKSRMQIQDPDPGSTSRIQMQDPDPGSRSRSFPGACLVRHTCCRGNITHHSHTGIPVRSGNHPLTLIILFSSSPSSSYSLISFYFFSSFFSIFLLFLPFWVLCGFVSTIYGPGSGDTPEFITHVIFFGQEKEAGQVKSRGGSREILPKSNL